MANSDKHLNAAAFAEKKIIENILAGTWKPLDTLPPERQLAEQLGITRPTLRETLQRLSSEGWITIRHGKPTIVNDYMLDGSLSILRTLTKYSDITPLSIIEDWLEFRTIILPHLAQKAVLNNNQALIDKLAQKPTSKSSAEIFANFDWNLQYLFVKLSKNTVALMLYNDMHASYIANSEKYFKLSENKEASLEFYRQLEQIIVQKPQSVATVVKFAMNESIKNFKNAIKN